MNIEPRTEKQKLEIIVDLLNMREQKSISTGKVPPLREICAEYGVDYDTVAAWLRDPAIETAIAEYQTETLTLARISAIMNVSRGIQNLAAIAAGISPNENTRVSASNIIAAVSELRKLALEGANTDVGRDESGQKFLESIQPKTHTYQTDKDEEIDFILSDI